jgi:hypothetical protein
MAPTVSDHMRAILKRVVNLTPSQPAGAGPWRRGTFNAPTANRCGDPAENYIVLYASTGTYGRVAAYYRAITVREKNSIRGAK